MSASFLTKKNVILNYLCLFLFLVYYEVHVRETYLKQYEYAQYHCLGRSSFLNKDIAHKKI